jgi:hypothetical protein
MAAWCNPEGIVCLSHKELCHYTGHSKSTLLRCLRELERIGELFLFRKENPGRGDLMKYRIRVRPIGQERVSQPNPLEAEKSTNLTPFPHLRVYKDARAR